MVACSGSDGGGGGGSSMYGDVGSSMCDMYGMY